MRAWLSPLTLVAGWALLLVAWAFGTPPFGAPDEESHYVRAVGLSEGQLASDKVPESVFGISDQQRAWQKEVTRTFKVPSRLNPESPGCYILTPEQSAACLDGFGTPTGSGEADSTVGTYQPLPYVLPAVAIWAYDRTMRSENETGTALRLGRLVQALTVLALLALATMVLWIPGARAALIGPALTVTPMVLFIGGALNGSGLEIAAAIAFCACCLRIARDAPSLPPWVWVATAGSGIALSLSRTTGPGWLFLLLLLLAALLGWRRIVALGREARRPVIATSVALAAGIAVSRLWETTEGTRTPVSLRALRDGIDYGFDSMTDVARGFVGTFGYLEFKLPVAVPLAWLVVIAAVAIAGVLASRWRERVVMAGLAVAAVLVPVGLFVAIIRHSGFGLQPRYVMPLLIAVPLLAGELLVRNRDGRIAARAQPFVLVGAALVVAVIHPLAWFYAARRSAVGVDGKFWFLDGPDWDPALGWWPWLVVACVGGILVGAAVLLSSRAETEREG